MKEKIYTIPVTDAFREPSECALCVLEKNLEDEACEYYLGPSLMEPEHRIETNEKGFCNKHFELLYNRQENRLGMGLIIDTHMQKLNKEIESIGRNHNISQNPGTASVSLKNIFAPRKKQSSTLTCDILSKISQIISKCSMCDKINYTMDRYIDVILYLWFNEKDFREAFSSSKGFCLAHFKLLLEGTQKYLNAKQSDEFVPSLLSLQLSNLKRIQEEVNWFTLKFDYRNNDAPWGNSKDAIPRSIQKLAGFMRFSKNS